MKNGEIAEVLRLWHDGWRFVNVRRTTIVSCWVMVRFSETITIPLPDGWA